MNFWHYTCEHGRKEIGETGRLISATALAGPQRFALMPKWQQLIASIIWLTDMDLPDRAALGLTRNTITCDRGAHRYRVVDYMPIRYVDHRRELPKRMRDELESAPGVRPMHWWMAYTPVPVVYDPILAVTS